MRKRPREPAAPAGSGKRASRTKPVPAPPRSVWEGVYPSFAAASADRDVFAGPTWIAGAEARLTADLAALETDGAISPLSMVREHPLSLVAAMVRAKKDRLKVLDFGGGLAAGFLRLMASVPDRTNIDYQIVEVPAVAALGRGRLANFANLRFHAEIPESETGFDLVSAASALHYVENWRKCLSSLARLGAEWLLFGDLPAGSIPTFVTRQVYYGRAIPVWFWNLAEFEAAVAATGYRPAYRAGFRARVLGREERLPMDALPPAHRLDHCCHLLFHRLDPKTP